jgi:tripartite-type tricarboxylate transporter receptor subunit TctC
MTLAAVHAAAAQSAIWPDRPIHLIVPFPAGSSSDIVARVVAQGLSARPATRGREPPRRQRQYRH